MTRTTFQIRTATRFSASVLLSIVCVSAAASESDSVPRPHYVGTLSCSAVACHGRSEPRGGIGSIAQNEFVVWKQSDPHARSTETIWGEKFASILARLGGTRDGQWSVETYRQCAGCHDPQNAVSMGDPSAVQHAFARPHAIGPRGIGCESCHGAASHWLSSHYERNAHRAKLASRGMMWTQNLFVRSQACSSCHVGSAENNMNHDMIAAGHPALRFEMTSYHGRLPKHWRALEERRGTPDFQSQLWAAGQVAGADAALGLLRGRAARANGSSDTPTSVTQPPTWPEFSEYSCLDCHQRLRTSDKNQSLRLTDRSKSIDGHPKWNRWWMAVPFELTTAESRETAVSSLAAWQTLKQRMQPMLATNAAAIVGLIDATVIHLHTDYATLANVHVGSQTSGFSNQDLTRAIRAAAPRAESWEALCQVFLALQAAHRGYHDRIAARHSASFVHDGKSRATRAVSVDRSAQVLELTPWLADLESIRWSLAFAQNADEPRAILKTVAAPEVMSRETLPSHIRIMTLDEIRRLAGHLAEQIEANSNRLIVPLN